MRSGRRRRAVRGASRQSTLIESRRAPRNTAAMPEKGSRPKSNSIAAARPSFCFPNITGRVDLGQRPIGPTSARMEATEPTATRRTATPGACVVIGSPESHFLDSQRNEQRERLSATRVHFVKAPRQVNPATQGVNRRSKLTPDWRRRLTPLEVVPGEQAQVDWAEFGRLTIGQPTPRHPDRAYRKRHRHDQDARPRTRLHGGVSSYKSLSCLLKGCSQHFSEKPSVGRAKRKEVSCHSDTGNREAN